MQQIEWRDRCEAVFLCAHARYWPFLSIRRSAAERRLSGENPTLGCSVYPAAPDPEPTCGEPLPASAENVWLISRPRPARVFKAC
jgi:hypothetical protein